MKRAPGQIERELARWARSAASRPAPLSIGAGQESVWDYPRPPRIEPLAASLRVEHLGEVVARTSRGLRVLETASPPTYYFPPEDVRRELLLPADGTSECEWKGMACYWNLRSGTDRVRDVAWSYPDPYEEYARLLDHLAFFASRVEACWVDAERARPQPGDVYGGWITDRVVGPWKGEPGTESW